MTIFKTVNSYLVDTENEAVELIDKLRKEAYQNGHSVIKADYTYKSKKAKGEIIAERYVVTIAEQYQDIWEDVI